MSGRSTALLLLLLSASQLAHAGLLSRSPCELLPVGDGHPVRALLRSLTPLVGCASRATAVLPQEVHVINLRRSDMAATPPDHAPMEVTLHLKPLHSLLLHHKPLVFVLNSPQPLVWEVQAEKLALGIKHIFHVSPGSQVHFQPGNFSLGCQVLQETLPHGNDHLHSWALKKYRGLTSFLELRMTHDVYINVGDDLGLPDSCRIDNKFLSLNYLGVYVEPQPSTGCVLSSPDQNPEVHIIELQAPNSSSELQVDVVVELRPVAGLAPLHRDVILILKCSKSVNWVIKSRDIIGTLGVLSSDTIALRPPTKRLMQVSMLSRQALPSGSQALINWAEQRGYRPVSFTGTAVADLFQLRLRKPSKAEHQSLFSYHQGPESMDTTFPPELAIFRDAEAVDHRPALPLPPFLSPPFHPSWEEPQEQQGVLSAGLEVRCEDTRMVVTVDKESLQASGYAKANLTLQDPECKATVNATHYTLETPLSGCQTTVYPVLGSSSVFYINSILISTGEGKDGSGRLLQDDEDQEPEDLRFLAGPGDMDKSFLEPTDSLHVVSFNCTYERARGTSDPEPHIVPGPGGAGDDEKDMSFNMGIYSNVLFHRPHPESPPTFSKGQQVFVEVLSSRTNPKLGFMILSCLVSPSITLREPWLVLVENLCPMDDSLLFYPPMEDRQRFSFTLSSHFNVSLLYLHCDMSPCSKHNSSPLPKCISASMDCGNVSLLNTNIIMRMMMKSETTQQLVVIPDVGNSQDSTGLPTRKTSDSGSGETVLYVLDTSTVVCIAFAAFVIGAMLTGALWFIYSNTGGAEAVPQHVVPKSLPVSENSSAAHSIGSTQSTPCSSSSTA